MAHSTVILVTHMLLSVRKEAEVLKRRSGQQGKTLRHGFGRQKLKLSALKESSAFQQQTSEDSRKPLSPQQHMVEEGRAHLS